jgi:hypothetical protein
MVATLLFTFVYNEFPDPTDTSPPGQCVDHQRDENIGRLSRSFQQPVVQSVEVLRDHVSIHITIEYLA